MVDDIMDFKPEIREIHLSEYNRFNCRRRIQAIPTAFSEAQQAERKRQWLAAR